MNRRSETPAARQARQQALARLMTRIGSQGDFPSLKESIGSIQRIVGSERSHMRALTEGVLKDVALTAKLLRLINAARYRVADTGPITSVQRALSLMGFQSVGMMAASLILFEKLPRGLAGVRVREDFSRALLAGLIAQELCNRGRDLEHSYLAALFQNLGRMLVSLHLPEAAQDIEEQIRLALRTRDLDPDGPQAQAERNLVAHRVLGLTTEDLGIEVATQWGWPEALRDSLRRHDPPPGSGPVAQADYLRALATAACDLSAQLHRAESRSGASGRDAAPGRTALVDAFTGRLGRALALDQTETLAAVERARAQWQSLAEMLGLDAALERRRSRQDVVGMPTAAAPDAPPQPVSREDAASATPMPPPAPPTSPEEASSVAPSAAPASVQTAALPDETRPGGLAQVLQRASERALSSATFDELAGHVLDDLRGTLSLHRAVLCLRTPAGDLQGRYGSGLGTAAQARSLLGHFDVPLDRARDLFSVLCVNARDTLISDASQPNIASRLPAWYRQHVDAATFLVLPLHSGSRVEGLLYFDRDTPGSLEVGERELALLGALRHQLLVALQLRQTRG